MSTETASTPPRRRWVGALTWVAAFLFAASWIVFLRPASLGGPAGYVIVSGASMEPMLHTGDLAVVHQSSTYGPGDVVAYRIPKDDVGGGMLVIHRIVGGNGSDGYILRGDNRDTRDMWRPRTSNVVGSLQFYVPHAGTGLYLLRTPLVIAGVIGFLGFWAIATSPTRPKPDELSASEPASEIVGPPPILRPPTTATSERRVGVVTTAVVAMSLTAYLLDRRRAMR